MAFARVIVAAYRQRGRNPAAALLQAQIGPDQLCVPDARITSRQMELLSGIAMQELDDEGLGAFARRLPWGSYGMLARASLGAPHLELAIRRWCRHHRLIADDITLRLSSQQGSAAISVEEHRARPAEAREFNLVHVLRNIHGLACWYIDSRIPLLEASFPFAPPPHREAYAHMFPGPHRFGAGRAEIRFDARYLALPLRRDDEALRQMLQHALPLTVRQYHRDRLLVQQVRQALLAQGGSPHTARSLAGLLHVSVRTLHRQLREEGASLQQIKDEVRFERARSLLLHGSRPIKQVAAAAGFGNEKSFIRAFRRWAGTTPAQFRSPAA